MEGEGRRLEGRGEEWEKQLNDVIYYVHVQIPDYQCNDYAWQTCTN